MQTQRRRGPGERAAKTPDRKADDLGIGRDQCAGVGIIVLSRDAESRFEQLAFGIVQFAFILAPLFRLEQLLSEEIGPNTLEAGSAEDRPTRDAIAVDWQVNVTDAATDAGMGRAEGVQPVNSCVGHIDVPRVLLGLPDSPDGQPEAVASVLFVVADRLKPQVGEFCRRSLFTFEEINAPGRHHAANGLRSARRC